MVIFQPRLAVTTVFTILLSNEFYYEYPRKVRVKRNKTKTQDNEIPSRVRTLTPDQTL